MKVEVGNPNVVWSASEDGTLRQHDFREVTSCPPGGCSQRECRGVLVSTMFPYSIVASTSLIALFIVHVILDVHYVTLVDLIGSF